MKTPLTFFTMLAALLLSGAPAMLQAAPSSLSATLDPSSIALGESAQLTVIISGDGDQQPILPAVKGLTFTPDGQSSSYQSINGAVTASESLLYQLTPGRAGLFNIPPIRLPDGASTPPLALRVLQRAGAASASPNPGLPPPDVQPDADDGGADARGRTAFLRVVLPRARFYVGQLVPVQVKAYFRAGLSASLNGLPVLNSDAFAISKLVEKPDRTQETVGGVPYTVLSWTTAISAVKAGDYPLTLELPVVVRVREQRRRGANPFKKFFGNSPFDDSFFDDAFADDFFGGLTEKPVKLQSDAASVKILPLPGLGRPADFTGAVGQFEVSSEAAPAKLTVGDPVTMRLKVAGRGNFDRVNSRGLPGSAEWKSYQPSAVFEPADIAGYEGTKTFEQAVVPRKSGTERIPAIRFSYFDPDKSQYVTRATAPITIEVLAGGGAPSPAGLAAGSAASSPAALTNPSTEELFPNKIETGSFVASLRPVLFAPWFIAAQGLPIMALGAALLFQSRRRRLAGDPRRRHHRAAEACVRERLGAMDEALAANNVPAFFTAGRQAVQELLAGLWHISASEVTSAEINRRLNGDGESLRTLFALADDVAYSGRRVPPAGLERWRRSVNQEISKWREYEN